MKDDEAHKRIVNLADSLLQQAPLGPLGTEMFVEPGKHQLLGFVVYRVALAVHVEGHEVVLRSRLADLFLDLVIDHDQKVAFTRQADVGELEAPILLRRAPLTYVDSVVLLFLRQCLTQADVRGERVVVESLEIIEQLAPYERAANTDHAGFQKRIRASVEKMKDNSILQKIRGSEDRYEISPTLKLLFSPEHIAELTRHYRALTDATGEQIALEPEGTGEAEEAKG